MSAVLMAPLALAQASAKMAKIGVLTLSIGPETKTFEAFRAALSDLGYVEGQNATIQFQFAQGDPDKLPALARALVDSRADVVVTESVLAAREAKRASDVIPIVTAVHGDPVGAGLAKSLTRPGGNVTGLSLLAPELSGKRLQLLKELRPAATRIGVLWNPANPAGLSFLAETRTAARALGVELLPVEATRPSELDASLAALAKVRPNALVSLPDGMLLASKQHIVDFAALHSLPAIYPDPEFAAAGGLMAYGPSLTENFRRAATYVDKILKGTKPAQLPIEQPTRFELVINLAAANSMGIAIPASLTQRADVIIQ